MTNFKSNFKKGLALALTLFLLIPLFCFSVSADEYDPTTKEDTGEGVRFYQSSSCRIEKPLPTRPLTFEAEVQLNTTGRGGVILGNYKDSNTDCISFEIHNNGNPRIYVANEFNQSTSVIFTGVTICSSNFVRLTITIDETAGKAHCYLNGEWKQTLDFSYGVLGDDIACDVLCIGGDLRGNNNVCFQGQIKSVAVYSDTRTADEVKNYFDIEDKNLLVAYDLINSGERNLSKLEGYDLNTNKVQIIANTTGALAFSGSNTYQVIKPFETQVFTYEAWVRLPKTLSDSTRIGTLFGNYKGSTTSVNFEFKDKASPRLYFEGPGGTLYDFHFTNVDARSDTWTFVAITLDPETGTAICYINGEAKETITKGKLTIEDSTYDDAFWLGRDSRGAGGYPFQGAVKGLAVYDDVRTESEIKADMDAFNPANEGLVAMFDFDSETGRSDVSGNGYHISYKGEAKPETPDNPDEPTPDVPEVDLGGLEFGGDDYATVIKNFDYTSNTYTFEATIQLDPSWGDRGGVILGNYRDDYYHYLNFEIFNRGVPRLSGTYASDVRSRYDYQFNLVDVRSDEPVHLVITLDKTTGEAKCYLNGQLKQTLNQTAPIEMAKGLNDNRMVLGNDLRSNTKQNFKGVISSVAVFSDIRTLNEIKADMQGVDANSEDLMLAYDLTNATHGEEIADLSGNGYTVRFTDKGFAQRESWFTEKEPVTDYIYSFAVVGDTQIIARNYSSEFTKIYDWILANKVSKKIGYVFGLGDITDGNSSGEWSLAQTHILNKLTGTIPYSVVRGNHDGVANFNNVFAVDAYMNQFDGFYAENDVTNSYRFFDIEGTKYLLFTLDYGANDSVLNWAGEIIKQNPDRKVIITTHAYLYRDGTTLGQNDVCPPATTGGSNNGDHMWDKLVSKYENIFLVMSGHDPCADVVVTQSEGINGNIVTQILTDHQGVDTSKPTGMVTMLYFKADGSVEVETYSTIQESFYKETNQFVIEEMAHEWTENVTHRYENGYQNEGTVSAMCKNCGAESVKAISPIVVFKGYSMRSDLSAICAGYEINYDALEVYETERGITLDFGVVACASGVLALGDNKPINADKTTADVTTGRIESEIIEKDYLYVSVMIEAESWDGLGDVELILCMFVIDGGEVTYLCDTDTKCDSASVVTYNQISARVVDAENKEGEDE